MDRMLGAIKKAAIDVVEDLKPMAVFYGVVMSTSPLKINVDQRLPLTEEFLILTKNVADYKTKISFDNGIKQNVIIHNGLKIGDKVILVRVQGGQEYVVWDKVIE